MADAGTARRPSSTKRVPTTRKAIAQGATKMARKATAEDLSEASNRPRRNSCHVDKLEQVSVLSTKRWRGKHCNGSPDYREAVVMERISMTNDGRLPDRAGQRD